MPISKKTLFISRLGLLISLTVIIQIAGFPQPITGPLINMLLFITTSMLGWIAGVLLGCLTPLTALIRGQLPSVLAPLVPFIAAANAILVLAYYFIYYKLLRHTNHLYSLNIIVAFTCASVAKYLFFILVVKIIFPYIVNISIPDNFAIILMTPQLLTALGGGVLFLIFLNILNRAGLWRKLP